MTTPENSNNELERLRALYELKILDTKPEEVYDRITRVAIQLFDVPMASICFVDEKRVWIKSSIGIDTDEIHREISICGHAITQEISDNDDYSRIFEVPDTKLDDRFKDTPLVLQAPYIRYYMGFVLKSHSNQGIGTLCIMDTKPREINMQEKLMLIDLGRMVEEQLRTLNMIHNFTVDDITLASNLTYKVFEDMNIMLKQVGITLSEWRILDKVVSTEFATPKLIGNALNMKPPTVSRMLDTLEHKELIKRLHNRTRDGRDRRLVKLEAQKEGKLLWNNGKKLCTEVVEKLKIN